MGKYKYIFFDLDGTISDSGPGIVNAVKYALAMAGISPGDDSEYHKYVGPPLSYSFTHFAGLSETEAETAVKNFRVYYADKGKYENILYPGIKELLQSLKNDSHYLAVTTSKLDVMAEDILEHFDIKHYFDIISGSTADNSRTTKSDVLNHAINSIAGFRKEECILIGDRCYDIEGAHEHGLEAMGVLYGYGTLDELREAGADCIANTVEDIKNLLA